MNLHCWKYLCTKVQIVEDNHGQLLSVLTHQEIVENQNLNKLSKNIKRKDLNCLQTY